MTARTLALACLLVAACAPVSADLPVADAPLADATPQERLADAVRAADRAALAGDEAALAGALAEIDALGGRPLDPTGELHLARRSRCAVARSAAAIARARSPRAATW